MLLSGCYDYLSFEVFNLITDLTSEKYCQDSYCLCSMSSLRGRGLKGKGKGVLGNARSVQGRREGF